MAQLLRSFRHWHCVAIWHQSSREKVLGRVLLCGAAEWGVLVKREDDTDPLLNYGYWTSGGDCVLLIAEASLSRWEEGDERKPNQAPVWDDYDSRCLPIPARLQGEHSLHTPENLKSEEGREKPSKKMSNGDEMVVSPMVSLQTGDRSFDKDDTLVIYLANDFHWRGARLVNVSGAGLAILRFKCKEKEVQLSRCVFVDAVEFENRVDAMAQTEDYAKRGLELPYGYRKEMLMMRLCRWKSRKDLKAKISQWFDRARDSGKSVSPREAAFVRECNAMVVVRADRSMQIRERKHRKRERAVYEHDNDDGEESKLMLYNNELGVRCPIRVSSCNYEIFELDVEGAHWSRTTARTCIEGLRSRQDRPRESGGPEADSTDVDSACPGRPCR